MAKKTNTILRNGKSYRVFSWGEHEYAIREKISRGARKRITNKTIFALYMSPEYAERARTLDYSKVEQAQSTLSALIMEYNTLHSDESECLKLESIAEPLEDAPAVREMYYEGDYEDEEVEAMLDFFERSSKSKTET